MALSKFDVERQRSRVAEVEGLRLQTVRYLNIDYRREEFAPEANTPRLIMADNEWIQPTWRSVHCDSLDWGVELHFDGNQVLSFTWEPPTGDIEGVQVLREELVGGSVSPTALAAIWEVGNRSRWRDLVGQPLQTVKLRYAAWEAGSPEVWLPRITLMFVPDRVEVLLGEAAAGASSVEPSATNLAIMFAPTDLPAWLKA